MPKTETVLQMLQIGVLSRRYAKLRIRLWRSEMHRRSRLAAIGIGLLATAGLFLFSAIALLFMALAWQLQLAGYSWPVSLCLTALAALLLMSLSGLIARAFMRRAFDT